ncbi:MAG: ABC transporter ATP-binding protein [Bacteroidota bacterium]|nr:ABC transporter ATP-binding protein [Bacteroidota bacterium]MEC7850912.1 ABC transporter ATP-binding protein [Bacteroidota bacterium]MEC8702784.1 ABC transporter ATP-binding protein [Bacteroidota bacterium]
MKDLSYLNKYLLKYKYYYTIGGIFILISTAFAIVPATLIRETFNLIENGYKEYSLGNTLAKKEILKDVLFYSSAIIVAAIIRGFFMYMMRQTIIVASRKIEYDLKNEIFYHYQTLPLKFYKKNNTGDLMNRISEDVSKVRMYLGPALMYGMNVTILMLMVIPFMFYINFNLAFYSLMPLPLLVVSIYLVQNIINKRSEQIQESLSNLSTYVQETFSGIRLIQSFVREINFEKVFAQKSKEYKNKSIGLQFVLALFFPVIMTLIGLSIIITVYVGALEVFDGNLSIGNIAEFLIYVYLLTWPVTALGWITSIIQRASASQKRINEFLRESSDITSSENKRIILQGKIEFKNVFFKYSDTKIQGMENISFTINPGDSLGIIGSTGSGKSTIANSILRLFDIDKGQILIDDTDIKQLNISHFRKQIGYVPQDVFLFSDTIENNILFGTENKSFDLVKEAAENADLLRNINSFPEKFETKIGERGITLSGGQKQRVSIARAIIKEPKILILDDCLSAVDTKTENVILENMKKIMVNKTSIIISHRISSVKLAKKIIVIDSGKIIEEGNHKTLLERKGVYFDLYKQQLESDK